MNGFSLLRDGALVLMRQRQPTITYLAKRFRKQLPCNARVFQPPKRPCFDHRNVIIERATQSHARMIKSFLYNQYWPREPSVVGLWMPLDSPYLEIISDRYSNSGDRFLAFEILRRTGEKKLIGLSVANKVCPWAVEELEQWAHVTASIPERHRMYFCAHCLRSPDLFRKYNVNYIYDVEILGSACEVSGQGVGARLLQAVLAHAEELRYPLVQHVALSHYTAKICEKCGMTRVWTVDYSEFVDGDGQRVFFPRRPHQTVAAYIRHYDPKLGGQLPCEPPFL